MAGKIRPMSQIKQLLIMHKKGSGKKEISRDLGISRNTVKAYLFKLMNLNYSIDELLCMEEPELEKAFHTGNPSYKEDQRYEEIKNKLDYFIKELGRKGVTRHTLWEEYRTENPLGYGYTQFCYHISQHQKAMKPSMVLNHIAGEKLYIDFAGKKLCYINKHTGEIIWCPVFVACLPYSDYCYVKVVRNQSIEEFLFALRSCLEFLGGVPKIIVPDNLKSAIVKANNYEPEINRAMEDFCNHYDTTTIPTRVAKPQDKALVENQVKIVYTRVYAKLRNEMFFSLGELNNAVMEKVQHHNQTRMQQKSYCREEKFLADEKHLLSPLPVSLFEVKYYKEYKVGHNNHIYLTQDKHYYSVPYQWTAYKAKVIYTRSMVRIFVKGNLVAVHQRDYRQGGYTTTVEHLCSHHQHYLKRSPEYYCNRAKEKSEDLYLLVEKLFKGGRVPEQNYKTCDGLFSLHKKTEPDIFNQACQLAFEYGKSSYRFVLATIERLNKLPREQAAGDKPLPSHTNIRGKEYYNQTTINFKQDESN